MNSLFQSPLFGVSITLLFYMFGRILYKKFKHPLFSPILVSLVGIIFVLQVFKIPLSIYQKGGIIIQTFLTPVTSTLAVSMFNMLDKIKKNFLPLIVGTFTGAVTSIVSVILLCKLFKLEDIYLLSMLPKSVTNPIALDLAAKNGSLIPITVISVCFAGLFGAILSPFLVKLFRIKNPIAVGVAIGTSSHGIGTSKAVEMGPVEGAFSSISIVLTGFITVFIMIFI